MAQANPSRLLANGNSYRHPFLPLLDSKGATGRPYGLDTSIGKCSDEHSGGFLLSGIGGERDIVGTNHRYSVYDDKYA